ncbi:MAG: MetQ/NlpA family ABC transporter substrate-binding protein [Cellulosilyticaceae bacterium]
MKKLTQTLVILSLALVALTGCASNASKNTTTLTVGASPVPHAEILEYSKPLLAEEGITLDIKVFTDYVLPNTALESGDLDANYFQHQPYLDSFNENNGTSIVSVASIHFEPLGIYPGKSTSLDNIQKGATIALPNDVTNEARALQLLESLELISLDASKGLEATIHDITSNPLELQFKELEAATIPRALDDVDFAVINGNYALDAGLADQVLASEESSSEGAKTFANILATREDSASNENLQKLVTILTSDEVQNYITEHYDGVVVPFN